jgi:hypothetical protein
MGASAEKGTKQNSAAAEEESNSNTVKVTAYPWKVVLTQFEELSRQRGRQSPRDYQREAEYIGSLFLSISGEPGPDGKLGLYSPEDLIARIRPYLDTGNGWMAAQGQALQPITPSVSSPSLLETALLALLGRNGLLQAGATPADTVNLFAAMKNEDVAKNSGESARTDNEPSEIAPELYLDDLNLEETVLV